jgi:hypothetical protein
MPVTREPIALTKIDEMKDHLIYEPTDTEIYILDKLQNSKDLKIGSEELSAHIRDPESSLVFSSRRASLLRPFQKFFKQKEILEINGNGGAITRFLGESSAFVVAVEANPMMAKITAERCRDLENVKVIDTGLELLHWDGKFDVVTLIGKFEAPDIQKARSFLKDDGALIISADNKFSLLSWAGAPGHHSGRSYAGIEGKEEPGSPLKLGKEELRELISGAGFGYCTFYFPFPDLQFPTTLLTEGFQSCPQQFKENLVLSIIDNTSAETYKPSFSMVHACKQVIASGMLDIFSNSFLVVASVKERVILPQEIFAWHYSADRKRAFAKETIFTKSGPVQMDIIKRKIYPDEPAGESLYIKQQVDNEQYIAGELLLNRFLEIISTDNWSVNDLVDWAAPYHELLLSLSENRNGTYFLPGKFSDASPFNLIVKADSQPVLFDLEWETADSLPLSYVFFRGIYHCLVRAGRFSRPAPGTPLQAFSLIREIAGQFMPEEGISFSFALYEDKYFNGISPVRPPLPSDFNLNVPADACSQGGFPPAEKAFAGLNVLQKITFKLYSETINHSFSEATAITDVITLTDNKERYSFVLDNTANEKISAIRIDPSEEAGLFAIYSLVVKDDRGTELFSWDNTSDNNVILRDLQSLGGVLKNRPSVFACSSNDPHILFEKEALQLSQDSSSFTVEIELSGIPTQEQAIVSDELNVLFYSVAALRDEEIRQKELRITSLLDKIGRQDMNMHKLNNTVFAQEQAIRKQEETTLHLQRVMTQQAEEINELTDNLALKEKRLQGYEHSERELLKKIAFIEKELRETLADFQKRFLDNSLFGVIKEKLSKKQ